MSLNAVKKKTCSSIIQILPRLVLTYPPRALSLPAIIKVVHSSEGRNKKNNYAASANEN